MVKKYRRKRNYQIQENVDLRLIPEMAFRKLGKEQCYGLSYHPEMGDEKIKIEIDSRLTGRLRLETIIHEGLHVALPGLDENRVQRAARYIAMIVWAIGYTDSDESNPPDWTRSP